MKNPLQSTFKIGKVYACGFFLQMLCIPILDASEANRVSFNHPSSPSISSVDKMLLAGALDWEEQVISGTVTDQNGEPIPGVTAAVEGTTIGTASDIDGKYTVEAPDGATAGVCFVAFQTPRGAGGSRSVIRICLVEDPSSWDEVVVVGHGARRKSDLTGSVAVVNVTGRRAQPPGRPIEGLQ